MSWLTISEYHLLTCCKTWYTIIPVILLFAFYINKTYSSIFCFSFNLYPFHLVLLWHLIPSPCLWYLALLFLVSWWNQESSLPWLTHNLWVDDQVEACLLPNICCRAVMKCLHIIHLFWLKCSIKLKCHTLALHEIGRISQFARGVS